MPRLRYGESKEYVEEEKNTNAPHQRKFCSKAIANMLFGTILRDMLCEKWKSRTRDASNIDDDGLILVHVRRPDYDFNIWHVFIFASHARNIRYLFTSIDMANDSTTFGVDWISILLRFNSELRITGDTLCAKCQFYQFNLLRIPRRSQKQCRTNETAEKQIDRYLLFHLKNFLPRFLCAISIVLANFGTRQSFTCRQLFILFYSRIFNSLHTRSNVARARMLRDNTWNEQYFLILSNKQIFTDVHAAATIYFRY